MNPEKLVTIGQFSKGVDAHLAKTRLESEGIECFIQDENLIGLNWLYSNAIGGVKLQVKAEDIEKAKTILSESPSPQDAETKESEQHCPACHSSDVYYEKFARKPAFLSQLLLGFPLPFLKNKWKCGACGHTWKQNKEIECRH